MECNIEAIKEVFDSLCDEESRYIFMQRLSRYLYNDERYVFDMLKKLNEWDIEKRRRDGAPLENNIFTLAEKFKREAREIVLYGAGANSRPVKELLEYSGLRAPFFCDRDESKHGMHLGLPVISPDELQKNHGSAYILITAMMFKNEITAELMARGFTAENIIHQMFYEKQYFGCSFMPPVKDEVFIDVGSCDGDSIPHFMEYCGGGYAKVIAMEPDPGNFSSAQKRVSDSGYERVELVQKGAWSSDTILRFSGEKRGASRVSDAGDIEIPVTTIDSIVGGAPVTLIKMDIEGSELEALKGAAQTIVKNKPRLAICIYHKPHDVLEIPIYIKSLVPDYKFYIRHHLISSYETVLYAVL